MSNCSLSGSPVPVFDGHNDVILDLFCSETISDFTFLDRSEYKHLDLPRAMDSGFLGGLFAIMVPDQKKPDPPPRVIPAKWAMPYPDALDYQYAQTVARRVIDGMHALAAKSRDQVRIVKSVADIKRCFDQRIMAMGIHFEGAEPIAPDLENLSDYYESGLRSVGIVWSRPNAFAHGVPIAFPGHPDHGPGLTDSGKALVKACNEIGIMIDLSHLNEKGFWDVEQLSRTPLVATHSNAIAICPSSRNLTDKQLDAIGASNGIVGINFGVYFLRKDGRPEADTPLDSIVQHMTYIADRIGIDHVALGSDFNGALIPAEIGDVTGVPGLFNLMMQNGFTEDDVRKIASENWLRVLGETWRTA